jgi:DNA modification methylase
MGIPWRVAFALQADGWYLRQDIIWAKPNPMPESVTDRCTKAHEYLFLLSKSARYHYDAEAIAEAVTESTVERLSQPNLESQAGSDRVPGKTNGPMKAVGSGRRGDGGSYKDIQRTYGATHCGTAENGKRNRRSVWTVATQPFSAAHFATFPPALIEPCIKAGCPKDCCAKCGAPVVREVERTAMVLDRSERTHEKGRTRSSGTMLEPPTSVTTGCSPSCSCDAGLARGTVLDPFGGAGTTGLVADRLQRDAILIELNPAYAEIARERIKGDGSLFAEVA